MESCLVWLPAHMNGMLWKTLDLIDHIYICADFKIIIIVLQLLLVCLY